MIAIAYFKNVLIIVAKILMQRTIQVSDGVCSLVYLQGDVQTAVSMHIVLGNKIKSQIDEELLENWMTAYLGKIL